MTVATTSNEIAFSQRRHRAAEQSISYLMQQGIENRDVISLAAGFVDEATLPVQLVRDSIDNILTDDPAGHHVLQYSTTAGDRDLRGLLLEHLAGLEQTDVSSLGVDADDVVVTAGSQQILQHVADVLLDPGDICLVAGPTYFVFLGTLNAVGARTIAVETDEHGMRMDALEATLEQLEKSGELHRVKLIYLVSWFENPSGLTLSLDRRRQVIDIAESWSKHHRLLILEDTAYRELQYDGETLPSVWMCDDSRERVILAQTFSKSFSPGLRVGYGVLPRDIGTAIHDVKGNLDFGSANLNQQILANVLQSGTYAAHLEELRQSYRVKRDTMLAAADRYFGDIPGVSWHHPEGGLYVWMTLPESINSGFNSRLFDRAASTEGVMFVPGEICYPDDSDIRQLNQMRLSFGVETPETIDAGMQRLASAVRWCLDES
jgi:2-aminoadipate transaminase